MFPPLLLLACGGSGVDTSVGLPAQEDTGESNEDSEGTLPFDTSDTGAGDVVPPHTLAMSQEGTWTLQGSTDSPTGMTGRFTALEVLDGDEDAPTCEFAWSLAGGPADEACESCDFAFIVTFTQDAESAGTCRDPELPVDGEARTLGYSSSDAAIYWNYGDTDVWIAHFTASESGNQVLYAWEGEVGLVDDE